MRITRITGMLVAISLATTGGFSYFAVPIYAAAQQLFLSVPDTPTDLKANNVSCPVTTSPAPQITWSAPAGDPESYQIRWSVNDTVRQVFATKHLYFDSNIAGGITVNFEVRAYNSEGFSPWSAPCEVTTTPT